MAALADGMEMEPISDNLVPKLFMILGDGAGLRDHKKARHI
jgi:hypothetical protein